MDDVWNLFHNETKWMGFVGLLDVKPLENCGATREQIVIFLDLTADLL